MVGAEPSLQGYTGMLIAPTAETLGEGDYHFGMSTSETGNWENYNFYGTFGLADDTEVGVTMWRPKGAGDNTYLHIKRGIDIEGDARVATGVFDLTGEEDTTVYAVATWVQGRHVGFHDDQEIRFLNLHAGFAAGRFNDIFGGVEFLFGPEARIMVEWIDNEFNIGARFRPFEQFNIDVGLTDIDSLVVNVSYNRAM